MFIYYDLDNEVFGPAFRQYHYYYNYYYYYYDSPLAVVMLHINTKTNLNLNPNLNHNCAIVHKRTRCGALFRQTPKLSRLYFDPRPTTVTQMKIYLSNPIT